MTTEETQSAIARFLYCRAEAENAMKQSDTLSRLARKRLEKMSVFDKGYRKEKRRLADARCWHDLASVWLDMALEAARDIGKELDEIRELAIDERDAEAQQRMYAVEDGREPDPTVELVEWTG